MITPNNNLPQGELFNVVTFGCKLKLNSIKNNEIKIIDYLRVILM